MTQIKSVRLNKRTRSDIVKSIMDAYAKKNPQPPYSDNSDLMKTIITDQCRIEMQARTANIVEKAASVGIPRTSLRTSNYFYIRLPNGNQQGVYWDPDCQYSSDASKQFVVDSVTSMVMFDFNNPVNQPKLVQDLLDKYRTAKKGNKTAKDAYDAWDLSISSYRANVTNVIDGVNTTKQLLEVWPEVAPFLPVAMTDPSKILLPTVNIASLTAGLK